MPNQTQLEVLRQTAMLLADVAESVAPLVEATQGKPSLFGEIEIHPTPREIGASLRERAAALRLAFPEDQSNPTEVAK